MIITATIPALLDSNVGAAAESVDFVKDVRPIFQGRCFECHGSEMHEAGLRLDRKDPALAGSDSGKVIVPGDPEGSPLIERVSSDDPFVVMPPEGEPLSEEQIETLRAWIDAGAEWPDGIDGPQDQPDHWAYQPIGRPQPPQPERSDLVVNPIDAFVLARLEDRDIQPSPVADRYTLIKRLYYDLLGLPPEPTAVDAFVNDDSPHAYERLVDKLLRSPHFGERWGRHWLDKARYADSDGYEKDRPRYNAWKYRDWVIDAINSDMPFDQFTIEQLAGDLLPDPTREQLLATAFHRQTLTNTEGGTDAEEFRVEAIFDRVATTGSVWLGLTVGCAQCHSHKYDPITQREYYELFAFFNNGDEVTARVPVSDAQWNEYQRQKQKYQQALQHAEHKLELYLQEHEEQLKQAEAALQQTLAAEPADAIRYHRIEVDKLDSTESVSFEPLPDDSYRVVGANSPKAVAYTLTGRLDAENVTGIRLDAIADPLLPGMGPGRNPNGQAQITSFILEVSDDENFEDAQQVTFSRAETEQNNQDAEAQKALDDKSHTSWSLAGEGQSTWTIFWADDPLVGQPYVKIKIEHSIGQRTLGRFRISAVTGTKPGADVPRHVREALSVASSERSDEQQRAIRRYLLAQDPEGQQLQQHMVEVKAQEPDPPLMRVNVIGQRTHQPRTTHVLHRGDFLQPQQEVNPDIFQVLHDFQPRNPNDPADRLDLARWLVSPDNPLTPRVAANHIWTHLFGEGLVRTVNDFGSRGEQPTHPKLLDWLASEFMRVGWSRKRLIKTILLSRTYRQSSAHRPELADVDPENRLLHRQNRFRVEAEIIRDLYLAASGLLERRIGGPSVFPPLPPDIAALSYANNFKWGESDWNDHPNLPHGVPPKDDIYRRGMYTFFKRTAAHPTLVTFDCPDANVATVERRTSNTPLQALTTLNNDVFINASRAMARRVLSEAGSNDAARLDFAVRLCVARPPTGSERSSLLTLLDDARSYYTKHPQQAQTFAGETLPAGISAPEAAAWTATARIIMNLDEFITRE